MDIDYDDSVRAYWMKRLLQGEQESYRGVPIIKTPEDLRLYQYLIDEVRPEVIIELGTHHGGSALWFADQLSTFCGGGHVITIDNSPKGRYRQDDRITYMREDLRTAAVSVEAAVGDRRAMVVEDSAHRYEVTLAALRLYSPLVPKGSFFVVEDTIVDSDLAPTQWAHQRRLSGLFGGVVRAIDEFLSSEPRWERQDRDRYGLSTNKGGWLKATR